MLEVAEGRLQAERSVTDSCMPPWGVATPQARSASRPMLRCRAGIGSGLWPRKVQPVTMTGTAGIGCPQGDAPGPIMGRPTEGGAIAGVVVR